MTHFNNDTKNDENSVNNTDIAYPPQNTKKHARLFLFNNFAYYNHTHKHTHVHIESHAHFLKFIFASSRLKIFLLFKKTKLTYDDYDIIY